MHTASGKTMLNPQQILSWLGVAAGLRVADLGCGSTGHFTFPSAESVGHFGVVYAVDVQQAIVKSIEAAAKQRNLKNVIGVWADIEHYGSTPIPEKTIDLALLTNTLSHARRQSAMLAEAARLLKRGGHLVVIEWHKERHPLRGAGIKPVDPVRVVEAAEEAGLVPVLSFTPGEWHAGWIFTKQK